jgi:hypothetical protein
MLAKLLLLAPNPDGPNYAHDAAFRLRLFDLQNAWRLRGLEVNIWQRAAGRWARRRQWLEMRAHGYELVITKKLLSSSEARMVASLGLRVFLDADDAIMRHQSEVGWFTRQRTKARFLSTGKVVAGVAAGCQELAREFESAGYPRVRVIPTVLNPEEYSCKLHETDSKRLVWIGSRVNLGYLTMLQGAFATLQKMHPTLSLVVICDQAPQDLNIPVIFRPWALHSEKEDLLAGDIGIAPTPLNEWTLGKSGFKIIQYMAAGLPVVASPVGVNDVLVRPGQNGYAAKSTQDWVEHVDRLLKDAALRARLGMIGRRDVEQRYNVNEAVRLWQELLKRD